MDEKKRLLLFIGGGLLLVILGVIIIFTVLRNRPMSYQPENIGNQIGDLPNFNEDGSPVTTNTATDLIPPEIVFPEEDAAERYARQFTKIFVERFGSFSSDNNNIHIKDVMPLVTNSMGSWVKTQAQPQNEFYSQTTVLVSSEVRSFEKENTAVIGIGTQHTIEDKNGKRTEYKKGRVELVYANNDWLVDGLYWE